MSNKSQVTNELITVVSVVNIATSTLSLVNVTVIFISNGLQPYEPLGSKLIGMNHAFLPKAIPMLDDILRNTGSINPTHNDHDVGRRTHGGLTPTQE